MKSLLRNFLINLVALYTTTQVIPALEILNGFRGLIIGTLAFMVVNILLVPFLKILLLPLNLLTLGLFAWLSNVLALYVLVTSVPAFNIIPYQFPGANLSGFIIPAMELTTFQVAIVASFVLSIIIHLLTWLHK